MSDPIIHRLKQQVWAEAENRTIQDVRLGLGYTAVRLDDGWAGAAFTTREGFESCSAPLARLRPLVGRNVRDVLALMEKPGPWEATLGLAAVNALINRPGLDFSRGDVLEAVNLKPDDRVGMVGYFAPLAPKLEGQVAELLIFEKDSCRTHPEDALRPSEEALVRLPECHVALITATALINGTLDALLTAAASCREVVLLGSSTPLCPSVFASTPVTVLSGMIVTNPEELLRAVSEGAGTRGFKGLTDKVNLRIGR